jgi:hypothetical protein
MKMERKEEHDIKKHAHHKDTKQMEKGHKSHHEVKHHSKKEYDDGYNSTGWNDVEKMLSGKHPITNLETIKCGGHKDTDKAAKSVVGERKKMAAGGVGKMRHEAYD